MDSSKLKRKKECKSTSKSENVSLELDWQVSDLKGWFVVPPDGHETDMVLVPIENIDTITIHMQGAAVQTERKTYHLTIEQFKHLMEKLQ